MAIANYLSNLSYGLAPYYYFPKDSLGVEYNYASVTNEDTVYNKCDVFRIYTSLNAKFSAYLEDLIPLEDDKYRSWNMTASNTILPYSYPDVYLYAKLQRNGTKGQYVLSSRKYNNDGSYTDSDGTKYSASTDFFYIRISDSFTLIDYNTDIPLTDGSVQTLDPSEWYRTDGLIDNGRLGIQPALIKDTDKTLAFIEDFQKVFTFVRNELSEISSLKTLVPFVGDIKFFADTIFSGSVSILKGTSLKLFDKSVSDIFTSADSIPSSVNVIHDQTLISASFLLKTFLDHITSLFSSMFLRKDKDDTTPFSLSVMGLLSAYNSLAVENGVLTDFVMATEDISSNTKLSAPLTVSDTVRDNSFASGDAYSGGKGFSLFMKDGKSNLQIDNLLVRMKATFTELEIRKLTSVGGNIILSAAASIIKAVVYNGDGIYRLILNSDDGTMSTTNSWDSGDIVRCQTFNVEEGTNYNVSNKNIFALVVSTGKDDLKRQYIDVNIKSTSSSVGFFEPNDHIVQFGNVDPSKSSRQNIIAIITSGEKAPGIIQYQGVASFDSPDDYVVTEISPKGNVFKAKSFFYSNADGSSIQMIRDRESYSSTETYNYYDRVPYNGSLWLCINKNGVTASTPSASNPDWMLHVKKGDNGADGGAYSCFFETPSFIVPANDNGSVADGTIKSLKYHVIYGGTDITSSFNAAILDIQGAKAMVSTSDAELVITEFSSDGFCTIELRGMEVAQILKLTTYFSIVKGGVSNIQISADKDNFLYLAEYGAPYENTPSQQTNVFLYRGTENISLLSSVSWSISSIGCTASLSEDPDFSECKKLTLSDFTNNNAVANVTATLGNASFTKTFAVSIINKYKSISNIQQQFGFSLSPDTQPSEWQEQPISASPEKPYIWIKETITFSDFSVLNMPPRLSSSFTKNGEDAFSASLSINSAQITPYYNSNTDSKVIITPFVIHAGKIASLTKSNVSCDNSTDFCETTIYDDGRVCLDKINNLKNSYSFNINISYEDYHVSLPFYYYIITTGIKSGEETKGTVLYTEYVDSDNTPHTATVGTIVNKDNKVVVQLSGEQIDLRGTTTINNETGNGITIQEDGTLYAHGAVFQGTIESGSSIITKFKRIFSQDDTLQNESSNTVIVDSQSDNEITVYVDTDFYLNFTDEYLSEKCLLNTASNNIGRHVYLCHSKPHVWNNNEDLTPYTCVYAPGDANLGLILSRGNHYGIKFRYGVIELLAIPVPGFPNVCQWVVMNINADFQYLDEAYS